MSEETSQPRHDGSPQTTATSHIPNQTFATKDGERTIKGSKNTAKPERRLTWVQPGHRSHVLAICLYGLEYVNSCKVGASGPNVDVTGEVTWLLVDTGSSIHVCKDRTKLINIRKKATRISGIVGGAIGVSQEVGDWPLSISNNKGEVVKFTLKNVAIMENASRNIISTTRLSKHFSGGHRWKSKISIIATLEQAYPKPQTRSRSTPSSPGSCWCRRSTATATQWH